MLTLGAVRKCWGLSDKELARAVCVCVVCGGVVMVGRESFQGEENAKVLRWELVCLKDRKRKDLIFEWWRWNPEVRVQWTRPSAPHFSQPVSLVRAFLWGAKPAWPSASHVKWMVRRGLPWVVSVGNEAKKHREKQRSVLVWFWTPRQGWNGHHLVVALRKGTQEPLLSRIFPPDNSRPAWMTTC